MVRWQAGHSIVLQRFSAYWESGVPRLDTIVLRQVEYAATRLQLLQRGEVDFILLEPLSQRALVPEGVPNVVQINSAPTGTFSVILHTQRPPFTHPDVRRALAWAVDKTALAQEVLGEYGVAVNQPFAPDASPWHFDHAARKPDTAQAKALLAKAGYAEGINVSLPVMADAALFINTALALQKQLQPAGIRLQIELLPAESVQARLRQGTWDLLLRGEESQPDPDDVYFAALHSSKVGGSNVSGYTFPPLDTLLATGRRTVDLSTRRDIYRQVAKHVQEDVPELYLFMARWPVAWRSHVQGYDAELLRCCLMHTFTAIANQGFKTMWLAK
jgi:peptide/nickel transport system substrate-binding protein/glutathione transport system substrate-binding protein